MIAIIVSLIVSQRYNLGSLLEESMVVRCRIGANGCRYAAAAVGRGDAMLSGRAPSRVEAWQMVQRRGEAVGDRED